MRFIINWLIKTALVLLFNYIGWLTLLDGHGHVVAELDAKTIGSAALIAAVFSIMTFVLLILSFGLAALLMVFLGGAILAVTSMVASGYLMTNGFWLTVVAGFILLAAALPNKKSEKAISTNT